MKFFPFSPDHHALFCRGGVVLAPSEKSENNPRDTLRAIRAAVERAAAKTWHARRAKWQSCPPMPR